jgi:thioredoxin-dependent peroxiredoxin
MTVATGEKAPEFSLPRDGGGTVSLADFSGRRVILYFYPKDDTSGCTKQACAFTENIAAFNDAGAAVIGVSKDSVASHDRFRDKYGLKFPLASDTDGATCAAYGVWVEKSMYGRKYMGIARTTFLIGADGRIEKIWPDVKIPGHIAAVLDYLKSDG